MNAVGEGVSVTVGKMDLPTNSDLDAIASDRVSNKLPLESFMYPSTLLGTFHSVAPAAAAMSAFRPLVPRPMHPINPFGNRPYPGWFP